MRKILASVLVFVFAFLVFSGNKVSAKAIANDKGSVVIAKTEVINDDLFIGSQSVEIAGTVNGDVFVGGQTVKITGIINGNLHVGANTIDIEGKVKGNVYAGGQSILVSASTIGGSLLAGGATVNVDKDTIVGGSIISGAGAITIDSQIRRSVYAGTGSLTIGENAIIAKDLYYGSGTRGQANISPNAKILGQIYKSDVNTTQVNVNNVNIDRQIPAAIRMGRIFAVLGSFIGALIVGLIYFKLYTQHSIQTAGIVTKSFWKSLGVGFLVTITFIPGLILLLITVVGIPLAGIAFLLMILYSYLAKIVVGSAFGVIIAKKFNWKVSAFWAFALGLLLIDIVKLIPFVGFLIGLTVLWVGLGALTIRMFSKSE